MTNRTWTGQMKQGFNNPWGDLNGFGSGGEIDFSSSERLVDRTAANIEEYKRQINNLKTNTIRLNTLKDGLILSIQKMSQNKQVDLPQQEINKRYAKYLQILSKSTDDTLDEDLDNICKLNY